MKEKKIPALITTDKDKRGVFLCYITEDQIEKEDITATDISMVVRWSSDMKGVLGLAVYGPSSGCLISPAAKRGLIKGVTAVVEMTPAAVKNWKKAIKD